MDLNSLTSQYLKKNPDASFDEIKSAVGNLTISYMDSFNRTESDGSIFSKYEDSDGLTQEEFINLMCEATGKSKSEIEKDATLLYQVLNSDDDLSSLTNDELAVLMDDGEITSFSVWNGLGFSEKTIKDNLDSSESSSETEKSDGTGETEKSDGNSGTENDGDGDGNGNQLPIASNYDFNDPTSAKAYISKFINDEMNTPEKVIEHLYNTGMIDENEAKLLKAAYTTYSDDIEGMIEATMTKDGISREEAIEKLKNAGFITEKMENSTIDVEVEPPTDDPLLVSYAEQLHSAMEGNDFWGTGETKVENILHRQNLSDEDLVKIMVIYNSQYGSFIQDIDGDFSGSKEDEQMEKIVSALVNEAAKGNELAIKMLSTELYNATAGYTKQTADSFLEYVFKKIDDKTLKKVAEEYSRTHDHDLTTAIDNDYNELDPRGHDYVNKINKARKNG